MNNSLRILGCYSGSGGYRRYPSSQLLILNNKNYLIDCGEGTQFLLKKYETKLNSIDNIFISRLYYFPIIIGFIFLTSEIICALRLFYWLLNKLLKPRLNFWWELK